METRLRYCNVVWGNYGTTLINKLQHLQNRAIEIIHFDTEPADLNAAFKDLSLLDVKQMWGGSLIKVGTDVWRAQNLGRAKFSQKT